MDLATKMMPLTTADSVPTTSNSLRTLTTKTPIMSDPDEDSVRVVRFSEHKAAAASLAAAFARDEVVRYMIDTPDMESRKEAYKYKLHTKVFEYLVAAHAMYGLVTTTGNDYGSVAIWLPPGADLNGWWCFIRSGLWRLNYQLSREGRFRWNKEFNPLLFGVKEEVLKERDSDSYYLVYIGTKPEAQKKGLARRLIEDITHKADLEERACYLESSTDMSKAFYQRCGFQFERQISLIRAEHPIFLDVMVREPKKKLEESSAETKDA